MTPAKTKNAEFRFDSWTTPEVRWTIEYPLEVMDEIRAYACNELLRRPHGEVEVGGVMYGSQRSGVIRILTWRPIPCDYTDGEMLRLSGSDRLSLAVQLEGARGNPELRDLRPVGWFVSHLSGGVAMNASDLEIHSGFFPESSQVTLVIRPTGGGRAEAGFFARETADDSVRSEASYKNFILEPLNVLEPPNVLEPLNATPDTAGETEAAAEEIAVPGTTEVAFTAHPPSVPSKSVHSPSFNPPTFTAPKFQIDEPLPTRERWLWAIPIALALGLAAWPLYQREKPVSNSPMAFRVSSQSARSAQLEWDPKSQVVRNSERGEMNITDGGKSSQVLLSADQLHAGKMTYLTQSGDVGFRLTVYPATGDPVHETTRLIAPALNTAAEPPQLLAPIPAGPASGAGQDALLQQVRQLTEQLRKERARSGELQNLNRILENRLGIQPEAPKAEPQP